MSAPVERRRTTIDTAEVVTARAVSARTANAAGELLNWVNGQGDFVVPGYDPDQSVAAGATKNFYYRVTPSGRAVRRTWRVYILGTSISGVMSVKTRAAPSMR